MRWNSGAKAPLRVVFVINSVEGGGAERVLSLLLARMETLLKDVEPYLILLDRKAELHPIPAYIKAIRLDCQGSLIKSILSLQSQLKSIQPDVVLSFLNRANCANVLAARTLSYRCILSERVNTSSHFGAGLKGRINKLIVRMLYPLADQVLAVSQGVAADLRSNLRVQPERLKVIYNPYDLDQLQQAGSQTPALHLDDPYIVSVGRLVPNKNFPMLIRAYHQSGIPEKLVILGEGPERDSLINLINELGLQERVILAGFVKTPYAVMARAAYAAFASSAEGFPNAMAEAMALGLPVVATDCDSGPAEILHNVIHVHEP